MFKVIALKFIALLAFLPGNTFADVKRAVVVGIGSYPVGSGWDALHGDNDVDLMYSTYLKLGFEDKNITALKNNSATKSAIASVFRKLIGECEAGDKVVFHFSGHGQRIQDLDGDEIDGWDECLVPYDAPIEKKSAEKYNASLLLTDDELFAYFHEIRVKIGPSGQLIVFIDACHSATTSRGEAVVRNGLPPIVLEPSLRKSNYSAAKNNQSGFFEDTDITPDNHQLGQFVLFSAAKADEQDFEYLAQHIGSLSYAVSQAFEKSIKSRETTFRDLYEYIRNTMAGIVPFQTPGIEGSKDVVLFGGDFVLQESYFNVLHVLNQKELTIFGGSLLGIEPGAEIGFFPAGTRDKESAAPLVSGMVIKTGSFSSTIQLKKSFNEKSLKQLKAFILSNGISDRRTKIYMADIDDNLKQHLTSRLSSSKKISFLANKTGADLIVSAEGLNKNMVKIVSAKEGRNLVEAFDYTSQVQVHDCDGVLHAKQGIHYIADLIKNYSINHIFKAADFGNSEFNLRIELVSTDRSGKSKRINELFENSAHGPVDDTDSKAALYVTNTGTREGYLYLLEFNPYGYLCPRYGVEQEVKLKPGERRQIIVETIKPPYGRYILKGFLTRSSISHELSMIIDQQPNIRAMNSSDVELMQLLGDMLDNPQQTRAFTSSGQMGGACATLVYEIKK